MDDTDINAAASETMVTHRQVQTHKEQGVFDFLALIGAWSKVVGPTLSQHTIPLKNVRGTLTILSRHSAFSQQLALLDAVLLEKIHQYFPSSQGKIKKLSFITNPAHFDEHRKNFPAVPVQELTHHRQSPVFKRRQDQAKGMFQDVADEELRQQLISIYHQLHDQ